MNTLAPELEEDLADLESAEDFLNYFRIPYDPAVVQVSRLHILQRAHDYLAARPAGMPLEFEDYRGALALAYNDFLKSDALTEKVFSVHKRAAGIATIPIGAIGRARH